MDSDWLQKGLAIARQCLFDARARLAALDSHPESLSSQWDEDLTALTDGSSSAADLDDARAAVKRAPLILVGDFATSAAPKELASEALSLQPGATLALTLPDTTHAKLLTAFLEGQISPAQLFADGLLAERIPRFAWRPYVGLLKSAARLGCAVELVEPDSTEPLATRHEAALRRIAELSLTGPVVALLGELRVSDLALTRLPRSLRKRTVRLLGDAPGPYFDAIAAGGDGTGTALLAPRTWSVQRQPPLTRILGFINWCESDEESFDGPLLEKRFRTYAQTIRKHFDLPPGRSGRLTVFAPGDPRYLAAASGYFDEAQMEHLATGQRNGESRYLPEADIAYLGQPASSHVAEEAAHSVRTLAGGAGVGRSTEDQFWSIAIQEMAAYLGSKVVDPPRRPPPLPLNVKREELDQEALAHLYGYQMAEKLWNRRHRDDVRNLMKTLFLQDLVEPGVAKELYFRSLSCVADRRR